MKDTCGTTPLMDAIRAGHVAVARYFVESKIFDINTSDNIGRAPIHLAAQVRCAYIRLRYCLMYTYANWFVV